MSPRDPQPGKKTPPEEAASAKTSEPERSGRPGRSSAPNALGVDPGSPFAPEKERPPVARARDLEDAGEDYEPAAPELIEWTPERAGNIIKAIGWALHQADGLSDPIDGDELGAELWKATEDDAIAIGTPLARILNRYQPARRLAGVSDEAEPRLRFRWLRSPQSRPPRPYRRYQGESRGGRSETRPVATRREGRGVAWIRRRRPRLSPGPARRRGRVIAALRAVELVVRLVLELGAIAALVAAVRAGQRLRGRLPGGDS